ncbi:class I SAM-dependent rRNA methyltransferase [Gilvimarinus algae]|uniref:Class I SAM-dependent rRNA methyltransferase n=1 Tax=Gilvimarinus algae TaxID=3058037 RepID=A0ABT8TBI3_9GAMM|nr:class I SAM-dependent rRNA methyltransferase [Gilvimarinus sp. SDUM040014]MDO3380995.1 class I SAM-dependent rRNA methyltransferase [Gilvimarinus sp. SDUM040014]
MSLPTLYLNSQMDRRLKRGHLWIYSNEVDTKRSPLKSLEPGTQVRVVTAKEQLIGVAMVNPANLICARLVSRTDQPMDEELLRERLRRALQLRDKAFPDPYYRLVFGDSDLLPGLVVDRFADYLVVQIATAGMEALRDLLVPVLVELLSPKGILLANDHSARELEGLERYTQVAYGEVPELVELVENQTRFRVPVHDGQKTGWFFDHRVGREQLRRWSAGARVLDVFSYIGGWGVEAATAGASQVLCVDASQKAVAQVLQNAALNGVSERVQARCGKAIEVLKALIAEGASFDVVVLDPPAFIKRRKDQKAGEAAYRHINELGLQLLSDGGLLVSASCSMHLAEDTLVDIVRASAWKAGRYARIIQRLGQGPDHPVHPAIVETNYLKAVFARVFADPR